jgi:hypothetical protein
VLKYFSPNSSTKPVKLELSEHFAFGILRCPFTHIYWSGRCVIIRWLEISFHHKHAVRLKADIHRPHIFTANCVCVCVCELPPSGLRQITNWWKPWQQRDLEVRNNAWCLGLLDRVVAESEFPNIHGVVMEAGIF